MVKTVGKGFGHDCCLRGGCQYARVNGHTRRIFVEKGGNPLTCIRNVLYENHRDVFCFSPIDGSLCIFERLFNVPERKFSFLKIIILNIDNNEYLFNHDNSVV